MSGYGYEEPHTYPCGTCGGIGFVGRNLTQPCRRCGTSGELTDNGPRPDTAAPFYSSPVITPDPWAVPRTGPAEPPPF